MTRRRFWTTNEDAYVRRHYRKMPTAAIAARLDRSVKAVQLRAMGLGVTEHRHFTTPSDHRRIVELARLGWCNPHIGREIGIGRKEVRKWRKRLGAPAVDSGGAVATARTARYRHLQRVQKTR